MPYCPDCGEEVPEDGRYCPACGTPAHGQPAARQPHGREMNDTHGRRQGGTPGGLGGPRPQPPVDSYPPGGRSGARVSEHGLLVGGIVAIALLGVLEGGAQLLFAPSIVEESGFGELLDPTLLRVLGGLVVVAAIGTIAVTGYYYRKGRLDKLYFGLITGVGVLGFLFGGSIVLMLLVFVGIYGFVAVLD